MSESFVDLTYRGLALGRRVKLTQVRPTTGYLELSTPMPVGTPIEILIDDDGARLAAVVAEIHEQVGGSEHPPGMLVKATLDRDPVRAWWTERVTLPELPVVEPAPPVGTVLPRTQSVPELIDDGRNTAQMVAVDPLSQEPSVEVRDTQQIDIDSFKDPPLVDDGRHTIAMAAVDLEALGLDVSSSGVFPATTGEDDDNPTPSPDPSDPPGSKPIGSVHRRKRKRR